MNLSAVHYLMLALGAIVTICQFVAGAFPQYALIAHAAAGVAGSLLAALGPLSPQAPSASAPAVNELQKAADATAQAAKDLQASK